MSNTTSQAILNNNPKKTTETPDLKIKKKKDKTASKRISLETHHQRPQTTDNHSPARHHHRRLKPATTALNLPRETGGSTPLFPTPAVFPSDLTCIVVVTDEERCDICFFFR